MCSYEDIYLARLEVGKDLLGLLGRSGTCEVIDAHGQVLKAFGEGVVVLVGQHRRGHHHSHLFAIDGGLEGGAHRHLGLAEAHITADEAVHGARAFHIRLHVVGGLELVGGVLIEEAGLQLMLQVGVGTELEAFLLAATAIELDEVAGDVLDLGLRALLHAFPGPCAETADAGRFALLALILRHLVQGVDGDIDDIVVVVGDLDHLLKNGLSPSPSPVREG